MKISCLISSVNEFIDLVFFTPTMTPGLILYYSGLTIFMHNFTLPNLPSPIIILIFSFDLFELSFDYK